jgi:multicomponent Na+:H+ antiporter subunit G
MRLWAAAVLMVVGAIFMLLGALGVARLPDLFTRMQAATKTGTMGASCILLGTALAFGTVQASTRAGLVIAFLFLTAPVAAHLLARAGYLVGVPLFRTQPDELRECFGRGEQVPGGTSRAGAAPVPQSTEPPPGASSASSS